MASTIRLVDAGQPETPPPGTARIFLEEYGGRLHLKMLRPDGTVEVFGTLNLPLEPENGGTGTTTLPGVGQILIGDGSKYQPANIVAGVGIDIVATASQIEISAETQNFSVTLEAPPEFSVSQSTSLGATTLTLNKVIQQAHKIYAGPISGVNSEPTFRLLVQDDIPNLDSSKITNFDGRVAESIPLGLSESAEIDYSYDSLTNKTSFSLKTSGVLAGTYGSSSEIPVITVNSKGIITSATTVGVKEAVEDYVGALIQSTDSINSEYDDLNSQILLTIKEESIITTNISNTENVRAPTSQAIKQYVDDNIDAERNSRIAADAAIQAQILDITVIAEYDNYVISSEDITRGYLTLSNKNVLLRSVSAYIDRTVILQDIDFVMSVASNDDVIFTFIGDILPGQPLALEVGENVRVNYLYTM